MRSSAADVTKINIRGRRQKRLLRLTRYVALTHMLVDVTYCSVREQPAHR